jgi:AcrR family transcriptional regulator
MTRNKDFVERFRTAFDNASMADVARRLHIPHATMRNYYGGRLPASDVLIKIANETGVSLNWLLLGKGDKYAGQTEPIGLGRFLEEKIAQMIDQRLSAMRREMPTPKLAEFGHMFDVEAAIMRLDDPQAVMNEWFRYENREYPQDYGVVFFRGWETFSPGDKIEAVIDAKKVLDRALSSPIK